MPPEPDHLSERDRAILDFEKQWFKHAGSKESAIREQFDISPTRYFQALNRLLDDPAALAAEPALVARLRRLRGERLPTSTPQSVSPGEQFDTLAP